MREHRVDNPVTSDLGGPGSHHMLHGSQLLPSQGSALVFHSSILVPFLPAALGMLEESERRKPACSG